VGLTRRQALMATGVVSWPLRVLADPVSSPRNVVMSPSIRPATSSDLAGIVALFTQAAQARHASEPAVWPRPANAPIRIERTIAASIATPGNGAREVWLVADEGGRTVGVNRATLVPVPPIYDSATGFAGLILDDCFTSGDAAPGTAEALLVATETALQGAGASTLIASCPVDDPLRQLYEHHGYEPVTLYMAKSGLRSDIAADGIRPPSSADVPEIVKLSAEHRSTLAALNPRFWHIHPDADRRFDAWMRRSLTLKDRDMFVATERDRVRGYVIAQPGSAILVPLGYDAAAIGVIDDFYDENFAQASDLPNDSTSAANLLAAAEGAFARRGIDSVLAVCPTAWSSKIMLLEQRGYRTAKLWILKR